MLASLTSDIICFNGSSSHNIPTGNLIAFWNDFLFWNHVLKYFECVLNISIISPLINQYMKSMLLLTITGSTKCSYSYCFILHPMFPTSCRVKFMSDSWQRRPTCRGIVKLFLYIDVTLNARKRIFWKLSVFICIIFVARIVYRKLWRK